ncbi:MAG TPA: LLM class flavin-dependent oxidoreductase [Candidatus Limnocylindrales bacterium]|nr:LLM class flavin-dependent oxidoreductase [Candidatus Limnocylindrales bacterium]
MKFGLFAMNYGTCADPQAAVRVGLHAEAAGLESLWTGEHIEFSAVNAFPRPVQPAGPPIIIGGHSAPARRRAVTAGNGMYLFGLDVSEAREEIHRIQADLDRYERPEALGRLELTVTPVDRFDGRVIEQYAAMGVDRLVLLPRLNSERAKRHEPVPADEILRTIDTIATAARQ